MAKLVVFTVALTLGAWIGRYNTERRSDALGGRTPAEFRAALGRAA